MSVPKFNPILGQAVIEWDDRLFKINRTMRHAEDMIAVLAWARMDSCSKSAHRISSDLRIQYRTGELIARMRERFKEENPAVFADPVSAEIIRQFTKIAVVFYELDSVESESEYGCKIIADHGTYMAAAYSATGITEEATDGTA